jgi:hypothetical protein
VTLVQKTRECSADFVDFAKQNQQNRHSREILWGCVKSIPPLSAAKESFERTSFFLILRSEIRKNDVRSKYYLA